MREEEVDYDYSEYLGPEYDKKERPCTLVVNHTSWIDIILFMYWKYFPAFVSKDALKTVPLVRTVAGMLDWLLINRESSKEQKEKIIDDIKERQMQIDEGKTKVPLLIFPEGTTTNGLYLTEFKRGAFAAFQPVKPVWVKYRGSYFHPTWETLPFVVHVVLLLSQFYSSLELIYMPIFVPNDYLFEQKKNLAKSKELVYAEAIREIMSKHSGLGKWDISIPEKLKYLEILYKQKKFT